MFSVKKSSKNDLIPRQVSYSKSYIDIMYDTNGIHLYFIKAIRRNA